MLCSKKDSALADSVVYLPSTAQSVEAVMQGSAVGLKTLQLRGVVTCIALLALSAGCRESNDPSDDTPKGGSKGGAGAAGKSVPTKPRGGAGGSSSAGAGAAGRGDMVPVPNSSDYQCQPVPVDPGKSGGDGAACCAGLGTCTGDLEGAAAAGLPHDSCSAKPDLRCEPLPVAATEDDAGSASGRRSCRVVFPGAPAGSPDYEGRCEPSCFVQASPILSRLSQSSCAAGEICSPCYSPVTGESTGSCDRAGDAPKEEARSGFAECGDGLGYCVPAFAAGNASAQLSQLTCAAGELCAPKIKVSNPNACFERCLSSLGSGSCVPTFLSSGLSAFLEQSSCSATEKCAPCIVLGNRSGVCD
jgi:hypothetical protein